MNSKVAVVPCASYEHDAVMHAVRMGLELIGAFDVVSTHEHILLKPNLLSAAAPEKAITTHPEVFGAVAAALSSKGYRNISYGDSPGNPITSPEKAADICGLHTVANTLSIPEADFSQTVPVTFSEGNRAKRFNFAKAAVEADAIVNICKMKTHALERITGAVKNMYGCVQGANKAMGHVHFPDPWLFAEMLCDIHRFLKPRLHIMDGITAMEGNGPSSGVPRHMGLLLFSEDPVALDTVFCHLIGLDPKLVPTCVSGAAYGIGTMDPDHIKILMQDGSCGLNALVSKYGCPDFDVYRDRKEKSLLRKTVSLLPIFRERPCVDKTSCIGCGLCEKACPVPGKAVHAGKGNKAKYDYNKCIRCYCCQEMCPEKAIFVKRNPFGGKKHR